jgi:hypothetical protein
VSAEAEFPVLSEAAKLKDNAQKPSRPAQERTTSDVLSVTERIETWADQVELSEATKEA